MRKRVLVVSILVVICALALVGCNVKTIDSYSIPLIDLDTKTIWTEDGKTIAFDGSKAYGDIADEAEKTAAKGIYDVMVNDKFIVDDAAEYNADRNEHYIAHPDSIGLRTISAEGVSTATNDILTMFPGSHGRGALKGKIGTINEAGQLRYYDEKGACNWLVNTPESWTKSQETPTIYRLTFNENNVPDANDMLVLIAGNPYWTDNSSYKSNGFNVSISMPTKLADGSSVEGREWTEFETWYGHGQPITKGNVVRNPLGYIKAYDAIVAMSSLTRLKEDGKWANKWMGLFHDHNFNCYKSILSFRQPTADEVKNHTYPLYNGMVMEWSAPEKYFEAYRKMERKSNMCEVECLRSDGGNGDTLALITRSNSKNMNSLVTFSTDEGKTWSAPKEVPAALSGERHKAEWIKVDGKDKLFVTFRSIERGTDKNKNYGGGKWFSEGYVAWVGDWDDLVNGTEGDFRVKIAHTYLNKQTEPNRSANGDTGYCGNVVLPDGRVATCSYGRFSPDDDEKLGGRTYIAGRVVDVAMLYKILGITA